MFGFATFAQLSFSSLPEEAGPTPAPTYDTSYIRLRSFTERWRF